ncbi:hypothetical protein [Amycolatopsis sp. WQ 127309]|nr:hypothetical protein [Amycolatopsis sp. WQ 127309]UOZ05502.1 hypothetical protein MUY22_42840 [Amycolatopsis sp. WQ 127309]
MPGDPVQPRAEQIVLMGRHRARTDLEGVPAAYQDIADHKNLKVLIKL